MIGAVLLAASLVGGAPVATAAARARPTFCVEWIRQSREGYERITLFGDRNLVWKTVDARGEEVRRKTVTPQELDFYCDYFARSEVWSLPGDLRTGLAGEFSAQSTITVARKDASSKTIRFDEFSALSADAAALRSALEGLRSVFTNPLAPASRFAPDALPPGTLLKRFDGAIFRVLRLEREKGFVELVGVTEPYSQLIKLEELRFQFSPPE